MSKILITGNGFDLFHHLPTKYHHFISIMMTIEDVEYDTDNVSFEELFGRVFKIKHQYEYDLIIENYNTENFLFSCEKLNRIKQLLETNLWYKYFKTVLEIETWIDFEMEIENVLNQFEIFNKYKDKGLVKKNSFSDPLIKFTDFQLFEVVNLINNLGAFKIHEKYINKRNSSINIKIILEDLAKSFEDFIIIFNRYLVDIVGVFYNNIREKLEIPFHLIDKIYTFNYTPTLENIYKIDKSKVVYLHGKISDDCTKQNLVLGVSEVSEHIKENSGYDFTKYHQKIVKRTNEEFIDIPKAQTSSLGEKIFYIIGHSLNKSDKEYIADFFKFLKYDISGRSKICVFCYDKLDEINKLKNLLSITDRDLIVEMHKTKRLYFVELNVENISNEFSTQLKSGDGWG